MSGFTANQNNSGNGQIWDLIGLLSDPASFKERIQNFAEQENAANAVIEKSNDLHQAALQVQAQADSATQEAAQKLAHAELLRAQYQSEKEQADQGIAARAARLAQSQAAFNDYIESHKQAAQKFLSVLRK